MTQFTENLTVWELWYFKAVTCKCKPVIVASVFKFLLARRASIKWILLATKNFHSHLAIGHFPHWKGVYSLTSNTVYSRTASVTGELQSQVPVTWLSLHFWWKMTFNPSLKICRFTINSYAWNQLKYTEDVYG